MITLLKYTEYPLQHIGQVAGICWHAPDDPQKNINRAKDCIISGHHRVMEYADVEMIVEGFSARAIRELYTHIIGTSRLQESTRYVDMGQVEIYMPPEIENRLDAKSAFNEGTAAMRLAYQYLVDTGIKKEDAANILAIGMDTKIVWKINLRALVHFMNMRLCSRALLEIRQLAKEIKDILHGLNDEWAWIADSLFVPNCEIDKFRNQRMCVCREKQCCGRHPSIDDVVIVTRERYEEMAAGEV